MLPKHYNLAIEHIQNAMEALYCADDNLKTIEVYLDLKRNLERLKS